ncbi:helix-turn-helix domain-containing protein [Streptomyces sp. NPDC001828]|uniref:helix-turn-helix domain-containing protein n=1 Tax=Streptomyces sp. NPDC001828 TaxID=3364615 RepID=UPI0036A6CB32
MIDQVGLLLRRLRTRSGLTQEQVAERSGVSVRTIRRLERGEPAKRLLSAVNLLADALDASPDDRQQLTASLTASAEERHPVRLQERGPLADASDEPARETRRRRQRDAEEGRVHDPAGVDVPTDRVPANSITMAVGLILGCVTVFLVMALFSVHDLLESWSHHGHLVPGDTTSVVGAIIGIGGALGALIGATLTAFARLVAARGQADADKLRAHAELVRAQAEMHRARTGQLPGPGAASAPSAETDPPAPDA